MSFDYSIQNTNLSIGKVSEEVNPPVISGRIYTQITESTLKELPSDIFLGILPYLSSPDLKNSIMSGDALFRAKFLKDIICELLGRSDHGLKEETFLKFVDRYKENIRSLYLPPLLQEMSKMMAVVRKCLSLQILELNDNPVEASDLTHLQSNDNKESNKESNLTQLPQRLKTLCMRKIVQALPQNLRTLSLELGNRVHLSSIGDFVFTIVDWSQIKWPIYLSEINIDFLDLEIGKNFLTHLPQTVKRLSITTRLHANFELLHCIPKTVEYAKFQYMGKKYIVDHGRVRKDIK